MWRALLLVACAGCFEPNLVPCGELACPHGYICSRDQTCVTTAQIDACTGQTDGASCTYTNVEGFCRHDACVQSLGVCGDGVSELSREEQCDCGTSEYRQAATLGCSGFNSGLPNATCRSDCRPAYCGDRVVDDQRELCDDGNGVSGDGCRADCQGRFIKMQTPTATLLQTVFTRAPNDAYAAGRDTVLHYDGTTWSKLGTAPLVSSSQYPAVWATSATDVYYGGDALYHYNGASWQSVAVPNLATVYAIWGLDAKEIYVGGSTLASGGVASLDHYDGTSWTQVAVPAACSLNGSSGGSVISIWGRSKTDVFIAATTNGSTSQVTSATCRLGPTGWQVLDAKAGILTGTADAMYRSNRAATTIDRFPNGPTAPTSISVPGLPLAAAVTGANELLAVGSDGVVLQLDLAAGTWTNLVSPTEIQLEAVSGTDPHNVFIVGQSGVILH